jgi:hypothetical protein
MMLCRASYRTTGNDESIIFWKELAEVEVN